MQSIFQFIGQTPIYQIPGKPIYAKLEKYNLSGSVKDRAVLGMFLDAQEKGLLRPGRLLIEATSGNTGISLALMGSLFNLKVVIVMPESMSLERRQLMQAYGAQLILTPKEAGTKGAIAKAQQLLAQYPEALALDQFSNPANPDYHYRTTAVELLEQVPNLDCFVAGVGTGGTFTGVSRALKEKKTSIQCVAVEPLESAVISGEAAGPHPIQGIGAGFVPANFDLRFMDRVIKIPGAEAIERAKTFVRENGIGIGISSGAVLLAAEQVHTEKPNLTIGCLLPDGLEKYLSVLQFDSVQHLEGL